MAEHEARSWTWWHPVGCSIPRMFCDSMIKMKSALQQYYFWVWLQTWHAIQRQAWRTEKEEDSPPDSFLGLSQPLQALLPISSTISARRYKHLGCLWPHAHCRACKQGSEPYQAETETEFTSGDRSKRCNHLSMSKWQSSSISASRFWAGGEQFGQLLSGLAMLAKEEGDLSPVSHQLPAWLGNLQHTELLQTGFCLFSRQQCILHSSCLLQKHVLSC